ncbi:MAG TPA: hypothetical protein VNG32_00770 [Candidatus Dormibacteraeota bacterium]|nr:hypothetical protein [Candidatus Dormibacteraeota bacterium]
MPVQVLWRRDTASNWTSNNPTLAQGELALETDTLNYKIGDGVTSWTSLNYGTLSGAVDAIAGLFTVQSSDPSPPSSSNLLVYSKAIAGRIMAKQLGPSGLHTAFQPFLARNKIGYWAPPGNATTLPGVFGYTAPTTVGTVTAANVATTSFFTRMRRLSLVSSSTAGTLSSYRIGAAQIQLGDGNGNGGFFKIMRFGCSDAATVSGARQFFGISTSTSAPTNVEPSTLTNAVGIGHGAADTNMNLYYGGSVAQTPINLGSNFPINTLSADAYELALFSPSDQFETIYYEVTVLNSGHVATGVIVGDGAAIVLPSPYTLMSYSWCYRTNNATALAVSVDIMSDYIETDN